MRFRYSSQLGAKSFRRRSGINLLSNDVWRKKLGANIEDIKVEVGK